MVSRAAAPIVALLSCCTVALGSFHEFSLGGELIAGVGSPGDPVNIRYVADSTDLNSASGYGSYAASAATYESTALSLTSIGVAPSVSVYLNDPPGVDRVEYRHQDFHADFRVRFSFPAGTLTSDALPLTLPLATATSASFEVSYVAAVFAGGQITSYESVEVPDPSAAALLVLPIPLLMRRHSSYIRAGSGMPFK
jgi:hypothetical protein